MFAAQLKDTVQSSGWFRKRAGFPIRIYRLFLIFLLVCVALLLPGQSYASDTNTSTSQNLRYTNYFAGVETWNHPNGLRTYFRNFPDSNKVVIAVMLPVGSLQDPEGRWGLAHYTEHMVFSDPQGKIEVGQEVRKRGGTEQAYTNEDMTVYRVDLPAREWRFGVEWLYRLLANRSFDANLFEQERKVIMIEGGLKVPDLPEKVFNFFDRPWYRVPDFREREFGIRLTEMPVIGTYESVQRLERKEIQSFFDAWYGPQNMILSIFGDGLDKADVKSLVDRTFGSMPRRGDEIHPGLKATDPRQARETIRHNPDSVNVTYQFSNKFFSMTADDIIHLFLCRGMLRNYLNETLRDTFKATYGIRAHLSSYGNNHFLLTFSGNFEPRDFEQGRRSIDNAIELLRSGAMPTEKYERLRQRAIDEVLAESTSPNDFSEWTENFFHDKSLFSRFPDLAGELQRIGQADLSAWMRRQFIPGRKVVFITKPFPIPFKYSFTVGGLILVTIALLLRRRLRRPADITHVECAASLHYSLPYCLAVLLPSILAASPISISIQANLFYIPYRFPCFGDDFAMILGWHFPIIVLGEVTCILILAYAPRRIYLSRTHGQIVYWLFRSRRFSYDEIETLEERPFSKLLFSSRILVALFWFGGALDRGVLLRWKSGRTWFFNLRNRAEFIEQFHRLAKKPDEAAEADRLEEIGV